MISEYQIDITNLWKWIGWIVLRNFLKYYKNDSELTILTLWNFPIFLFIKQVNFENKIQFKQFKTVFR